MPARPLAVTAIAWWAILWYGLVFIFHVFKLGRLGAVEAVAVYEIVAAAARVFFAAGMLRRSNDSRVFFLATYAVCAVSLDAVAYAQDWMKEPGLIFSYVFNLVLLLIISLLLSQPSVLVWFEAATGRAGPERLLEMMSRWREGVDPNLGTRLTGWGFITISSAIFLFFVWHLYQDAMTLVRYERAEGEIISADFRSADVQNRRSSTSFVTHDPKVSYRYQAGGRTYTSSRFSTFGTTIPAMINPGKVREVFTPGSRHPVWYDPSNPHEAVIARGISPYYAFAFFNLILLVIGRVILSSVKNDRSASGSS